MAAIGALTSFTAGTTILAAEVNSNFSAIRTAFNDTAVLTDTAKTIAVTHTFSAVQKFADGAVGSPSFQFSGDTDTGIYRIGANNLGITVGATKIVDVASTGITVTGEVYGTTLQAASYIELGTSLLAQSGVIRLRNTDEIVSRDVADSSDISLISSDSGNRVVLGETGKGLKFGTHSAVGAETVTGYITVTDWGGTNRKLAVVS